MQGEFRQLWHQLLDSFVRWFVLFYRLCIDLHTWFPHIDESITQFNVYFQYSLLALDLISSDLSWTHPSNLSSSKENHLPESVFRLSLFKSVSIDWSQASHGKMLLFDRCPSVWDDAYTQLVWRTISSIHFYSCCSARTIFLTVGSIDLQIRCILIKIWLRSNKYPTYTDSDKDEERRRRRRRRVRCSVWR